MNFFKATLFLAITMIFGQFTTAQTYIMMDGDSITTCSGTFFDSGGGNGNYGANESMITTICSDNTTGTHISLNFPSVDIDTDILNFYDGINTAAPFLADAADFAGGSFIIQATAVNTTGCLTIEFISDDNTEGAGWAAVIECVPACQLITAVLDFADPPVFPLDTGYIDICVGDAVVLEGSGLYPQDGQVYNHSDFTSSFSWNFGDGGTGIGPNVSHTYNEPGGYIIQLEIRDQFDCRNTNFISQRVRVSGPPEVNFGDYEDEICVGDTVELTTSVNFIDSTNTFSIIPTPGTFQTGATLSDSLALPDGTGVAYSTSVSFNNFAPGQVLTDVNDIVAICMNIEHEYMRDLEITLTAPNGTTVILHDHPGPIGGEVFLGEPVEGDPGNNPIPGLGYDYTWSASGILTWIEYANANNPQTLPPGDYATFDPLSNLLGTPLNGEWTISVEDLWGIDNGFIFSWGIKFNSDLYPDIETFTPEFVAWDWVDQPIFEYSSPDSVAAIPTSAGIGNFVFEVIDTFGCTWESNVYVNFLPEAHPDCFTCSDIISEFPDTLVCVGDTLVIDAGGANLDFNVPFTSYTDYAIGFANHPPSNPYNATIGINSIETTVVSDPLIDIVEVCIDFQTNFLSDVSIYLQAPNGTIIELTTNNGGTSDFYTNTCFTPSAVTPITSGTTPFTGTYQIEGNWADLIGAPINGDWTLLVSDDSGISAFGNLNWWSITFASGISTDITWSPVDNIDCVDCPVVNYISDNNTSQTLIVNATNSLGCIDADTINISLTDPIPAPTVSCNNDTGGTIIFSWPQIDTFTNYLIDINGSGFVLANGGLSHTVSGLNNGDLVTATILAQDSGEACNVLTTTIDCYNCIFSPALESVAPVSCFDSCDGQAVLSVSGGDLPYQYSYTDAFGNLQIGGDSILNNLCPGPQVVSIIDGANCVENFDITVGSPDDIIVIDSLVTDVTCFGESNGSIAVSTQGGVGSLQYDWFDASSSPVDSFDLVIGNYTLVLTDDNDCKDTTFYSIEEPDDLSVSILDQSDANCFGDLNGTATVGVTGGVYPYNYAWTGYPTVVDSINTVLSSGTTTLQIVDDNGCNTAIDILIGEPAAISLPITQLLLACDGIDANEATASVSGGSWPYTFEWSSSSVDSIANNLPAGLNYLTITDDNGCTQTDSILINDLEPIQFSILTSNPDCFEGANGSIEVNLVQGGSTSGYSYIFNNNTPIPDNIISGLSAGVPIDIQVIDDQGCLSDVTTAQLNNPSALNLIINTVDVSCGGYMDGTATVTQVENGQAPFEYNWSAPSGTNSQSISDLSSGNFNVTVIDDLGCEVVQAFAIFEPSPVEATWDLTIPPCNGKPTGGIDLSNTGGAGGYTYEWSNGEITQDLVDIFAGTYVVTVTDANDCAFDFSIDVYEPTPIDPNILTTDVTCYNKNDGSIELNTTGGTPPYTYDINGQSFFGNPTLIGQSPGTYNIEIVDDNGCVKNTTITINEPAELMLNLPSGNILEIELEDEILLDANYISISNAQGNYQVSWIPDFEGTLSCDDCENPLAYPYNTISYIIVVEDEMGCVDEARLTINVLKERVVLVPPAFTPNGDNNNDILLTHGKDGTIVNVFQVFDRWGELVFETTEFEINADIGWDGTFRGNPMPMGAYIWHAEVTFIDGVTEKYQGQTNLIR